MSYDIQELCAFALFYDNQNWVWRRRTCGNFDDKFLDMAHTFPALH